MQRDDDDEEVQSKSVAPKKVVAVRNERLHKQLLGFSYTNPS
jgi:hypothetical protein